MRTLRYREALREAMIEEMERDSRVFLMGDAVACAKRGQTVPNGYYNLNRMLQSLTLHTTEIGVCGTCMDARGMTVEELVEGAKRSTLDELAQWTTVADKVIVF